MVQGLPTLLLLLATVAFGHDFAAAASFPNATALVDATFSTSAKASQFIANEGADIEVVLNNGTDVQFAFVGVRAVANLASFQSLSAADLLANYGIVRYSLAALPTTSISGTTTAPTMAPVATGCSEKGSTTVVLILQPSAPAVPSTVTQIVTDVVAAVNSVLSLSTTPSRINVLTSGAYTARKWNGTLFLGTPEVAVTFAFTLTQSPTDVLPADLVLSLFARWPQLQSQLSRYRASSLICLPATFQETDPTPEDQEVFKTQRLKFMGALIAVLIICLVFLGAGWVQTQRLDKAYQATPEFQAFSAYLNSGVAGGATLGSSFFKPSVMNSNASVSPARESSPIVLATANNATTPGAKPADTSVATPGVSPIVRTPASMRTRRAVSFHATATEL